MVSGAETLGGKVISVTLSQVSMAVLAVCLCKSSIHSSLSDQDVELIKAARRVQNVRDWGRLPLVCWCKLLCGGSCWQLFMS